MDIPFQSLSLLLYFGGMLMYLWICKMDGHVGKMDAIAGFWWPFAIWDRLPPDFQAQQDEGLPTRWPR
jgi:hypothetical protein